MYLFFDTETTGLSRSSDHLVQLAWILADEHGEIESEGNYIIRPSGYRIPPTAARIHGITTDIALAQGVDLREVLEAFSQASEQADVFVAHNLSFDEGFLQSSFARTTMPYPLAGKTRLCTMTTTTDWCALPKPSGRPGFKWPKLEELHKQLFGYVFEDAHDALADTRACMDCYFELISRNILATPSVLLARRTSTTKNASSPDLVNPATRLALAANPNTPDPIIERLLDRGEFDVSMAILMRSDATRHDWIVRLINSGPQNNLGHPEIITSRKKPSIGSCHSANP